MKNHRLLLSLHSFNALTAIAGGIGLIAGWISPGTELIENTDFTSYYWPGVILLCIVGGSALLAVIAITKKLSEARLIGLLAGLIMLFWIICEVISIREFHFLQIIYLATSVTILAKTK